MIMAYFFANSEDAEHKILLDFSKEFKFMRKSIFNLVQSYELKKEDFENMYENNKIKLFKGLLENADIINNEYKYIPYVNNSLTVLNKLKENFDKNEVNYTEINKFFEEGKI